MNEAELVVDAGPSALESITRAEVDMQIATARKFPRQISRVLDKVRQFALSDEETAAACFFSLPRAGKAITGESVRLAEILSASYGNVKAAWRPVNVDRVNGTVTCQGVCHDLENNVSFSLEKTRQIQKKRGATGYDEDMITLAINACGAIAYRDAVFKVIPKALIKPLLAEIKECARGKGTLPEKVDRVVKRLLEISPGIQEGWILASVDARKREDIDIEKLDRLIGAGTAIKEGEIRPEAAFPDPKKVDRGDNDPFAKKDKAKGRTEGKESKGESKPEKSSKPDPEPEKQTAAESTPDPSADTPQNLLSQIQDEMLDAGITEAKLLKKAAEIGILATTEALVTSVKDLSADTLSTIISRWEDLI